MTPTFPPVSHKRAATGQSGLCETYCILCERNVGHTECILNWRS